eukprot:8338680-Pyramimonas_sp.AAC.1
MKSSHHWRIQLSRQFFTWRTIVWLRSLRVHSDGYMDSQRQGPHVQSSCGGLAAGGTDMLR